HAPAWVTGPPPPPFSGADESNLTQRPANHSGARLPLPQDASNPRRLASGRASPDAMGDQSREPEHLVPGRLVFAPPRPVRSATYDVLKDPTKVKTMEDAQVIFQAAGASGLKVE